MNLVGYCRVSTDNQRDEGTIVLQEHALEEFCRANGHQLIALYKDEGVSGDQANRPGLSKMFDFLECSRGIDGVLIYKLDRLARDLYMQEHVIRELGRLGLELVSTKEPDLASTDPMRVAFRQFQGIIAELEKTMITWRLSSGRLNKARKGGYAGGRAAFGYRVTADKDLVIDPLHTPALDLIFKLRRKKQGYHEIARQLNQRSVAAPGGGVWYPGSVKYIVDNPLYRGHYAYKDEGSLRTDLAVTGKHRIATV